MKEYFILIACLATAVIAGDGFWQNPLDIDTDSILQARKFDKYLISSSEPGRPSLIVRGLAGQNRPRPISANTPSPRTSKLNPKSGTRLRGVDSEHRMSKLSNEPPPPDHSESKNGVSQATAKTKYKAIASISAKGPASYSVASFDSKEDFLKIKGHEQIHSIPADVTSTLATEHHFGTTAAGFACDKSPHCNKRKNRDALKANAQGSTVYTTVVAPVGGRGRITFKESGKKEVVNVPGGKTVEELRSSSNGPIRATAKVSRGGHVRIASKADEEDYRADNGKA